MTPSSELLPGACRCLLEKVAFAFVGAVVPASDAAKYPAFSVAGNLWQTRLLDALSELGLKCRKIFSIRPVPSFPGYRRIWLGAANTNLSDGLSISYIPFVNLGPLKTLTVAIANFVRLVFWGWQTRRTNERLIVSYNVSSPLGLSTAWAARLCRAKAVAVVADFPVPGHGIVPSTPLRRAEFALQVKSLHAFDGLIVLTRHIAEDFAPGIPYLLLEGAIDKRIAESSSLPVARPTADKIVLMYAGLLSDFDGVPLLLEAFALLADECYRLVIVGRGPERARVEEAARRDPRIEYLGYLPNERVLDLYRHADILLNPRPSAPLSARYVFPSKLIEYLATGTPVITTATAEVEEQYGDYTFILRDESAKGLAGLIRAVASMSSEERAGFGHRSRSYMLQHKTWQVQAQRIADFFCSEILPAKEASGAFRHRRGRHQA